LTAFSGALQASDQLGQTCERPIDRRNRRGCLALNGYFRELPRGADNEDPDSLVQQVNAFLRDDERKRVRQSADLEVRGLGCAADSVPQRNQDVAGFAALRAAIDLRVDAQ
jgi:hypothetical protein